MIPHHRANRVRGIAVTSAKRNHAVPDLPTVAETITGYESVSWSAVLAPRGLPKEISARWNMEINRLLKTPEVKSRMEATGLEVAGSTQSELHDLITKDIDKWKQVVRAANIKI